MALGSLVWDASATMIDVPLENAINMHSVWTAWFQFWGKQHHLHIDVLVFYNIVNVQHRIEWVQLERLKKGIKMQCHLVIAFCVPSSLTETYNSNAVFYIRMWIFILNLTNIRNSIFFFELVCCMVQISYAYKKNMFLESKKNKKRVTYKSHFIISFRNRPTRITNIINTET